MKIELKDLITCDVAPDGEVVNLNFTDAAGVQVCLQLPFDSAQSMAMTLPRLLTVALRRITGKQDARYVFPVGSWRLEYAEAQTCVITTFATGDGFEVSFGIPFEACRGLGWALRQEGESLERATEDAAVDDRGRLN